MGKVNIKIYDDTEGNRWGDFVSRNKKLYSHGNPFVVITKKVFEKLFRGNTTYHLSKERIEELAREPQLIPPIKVFKISRKDKIFTIGSCFARYIRDILERINFDVYPKFMSLKFDPSIISIAGLPRKNSLIWYNSFTIRQEFDKAFGLLTQDPNDVWTVENSEYLWERYPQFRGKTIYNDPYRRHIFSTDRAVLNNTIKDIDLLIKGGIEKSDIFLITLGVTEVWRKKDSELICCAMPNFFNFEEGNHCELILSDFEDNYSSLRSIVENLNSRFPGKKIVFTVSPVPLSATFSGNDIYFATDESKAILRVAANKIAREYDNVYYFPAYEIFQLIHTSAKNKAELFNRGGRNLSIIAVERIMAHFLKLYVNLEEWGAESIEFSLVSAD